MELLCALLLSTLQDPDMSNVVEPLMEADRAFCRDTVQRGVEGWLSWFAEDAVIFPARGAPVRGRDAVDAYYRGRPFPPPGFRWEPERGGASASGDVGWTLGSWTAGADGALHGTYVSVWRRDARGNWRVVADCGGDPEIRQRLPRGSEPGEPVPWHVIYAGRSAGDDLRWQAGTLGDAASGTPGRFLSVWRRDAAGWRVAVEIGDYEDGAVRVRPWPEANARLEEHPRWLGADDAYTVDLGADRILWLFADTFVGNGEERTRRGSRMIRNSLAIQRGRDPVTASFAFHWRTVDGRPESFFERPGETWFWPGDGERVGDALFVFLMEVRSSTEGLGFEAVGWRAVRIPNPDEDPAAWRVEWLDVPANDRRILVGAASVFVFEGWLWACSPQESRRHDVHLVRWPLADLRRGDLSGMAWWAGERGFVPEVDASQPIITDAQTEFTMHRDAARECFVVVQTEGFGGTTIGLRTAPRPEGPWTPSTTIHRPPESDLPGVLVYAAKAHPELAADGLVLTYVANHTDFATVVDDLSLYVPRFLRVWW